jgi:hypothetical protein
MNSLGRSKGASTLMFPTCQSQKSSWMASGSIHAQEFKIAGCAMPCKHAMQHDASRNMACCAHSSRKPGISRNAQISSKHSPWLSSKREYNRKALHMQPGYNALFAMHQLNLLLPDNNTAGAPLPPRSDCDAVSKGDCCRPLLPKA